MNDNFFGSSSVQPSDNIANIQYNTTQQQDYEALYFSGQTLTSDMDSAQHNQAMSNNISAAYNNVHANIPFVQIHTTDVQPQQNYGNVFRRTVSQNQGAIIKSEPIKSEGADNGKERANATPTPPVRNASCNSSEQRIPTESINQNAVSSNGESVLAEADSITADVLPILHTQTFHKLNVYRCSECLFLCLDETNLENHVSNEHNQTNYGVQKSRNNKHRILCPGCSNVFFTSKSFEVHLLEDHFASLSDVKKMLGALECNTEKGASINNNDSHEDLPACQHQQQQRKSRIYLKNVECLREPHLEPMDINGPGHVHTNDSSFFSSVNNDFNNVEIEHDNNDLSDLLNCGDVGMLNGQEQIEQTFSRNECSLIVSGQQVSFNQQSTTTAPLPNQRFIEKPKQKISIKSVDVLREPALLQRDYKLQCQEIALSASVAASEEQQKQQQHHQYNAFNVFETPAMNVLPNSVLDVVNFNSQCNNYQVPASKSLTSIADNDAATDLNIELGKPRRPKIYIKNVDILKEPMMPVSNFENKVKPPTTLPPPQTQTQTSMGLTDNNAGALALGGFTFLNTDFMSSSACNITTTSNIDYHDQCDISQIEKEDVHQEIPTSNFLYEMPALTLGTNNINNNNSNILGNDIGLISNVEDVFASYSNNGTGNVSTSYLAYPPVIVCDGLENACTLSSSTTPVMTEPTPPLPQAPPPPPPPPPYNIIANSVTNASTLQNDINVNVDALTTENTPQSVQQQQQKQKQKIFIKNVDILKQPPPSQVQVQRGTLHLRTVDELNLMNRNEVEGLIAPNLDHSNVINAETSLKAAIENESEHENNHQQSFLTAPNHQNNHLSHNNDLTYYDEDSTTLKLQDYATQLVNSCWSNDDYDLGNDIDCIITDAMPESMSMLPPDPLIPQMTTNINDLDTPQMSLISLRDIDELTLRRSQSSPRQQPSPLPEIKKTYKATELQKPAATIVANNNCSSKNNDTVAAATFNFHASLDSPPPLAPLAPVTHATPYRTQSAGIETKSTPPPPTQTNYSALDDSCQRTACADKDKISSNTDTNKRGRIYVANNLVQADLVTSSNSVNPNLLTQESPTSTATVQTKSRKTLSVSIMGGTSVQGRPFGFNRAFNDAKLNKRKPQTESTEAVVKCSIRNCAFRFKKPDTLAYHQRCHDSAKPNSWQAKVCPECNQKDFSNWNTLHTHLWRTHKIDMELYSCTLCPFKTPIYSRLVNTHTKIHSEERNYKCELCGKGFKNTKQLKNHRRWHRVASKAITPNNLTTTTTTTKPMLTTSTKEATSPTSAESITKILDDSPLPLLQAQSPKKPTTATNQLEPEISLELHRCNDCGSLFSHSKTLREHNCKKNDHHQLTCSICGHAASSKSAFKLHKFTHENAKRLKCAHCTYSTSDHNAFRRHKMTHEKTNMYECTNCNYKSIQSSAFQKHVLAKHPEDASEIIHRCKICTYSTVSRGLFALHQIKHSTAC